MRHAIASSIGFYQRHLSPLKGFCCAHNHLHGRGSCSQFAQRVVLKFGVVRLIPLLKLRFRACRRAFATLSESGRKSQEGGSNSGKEISGEDIAKSCAADAAVNFACCSLFS
jgi:putative component of membrane protein insertase Oxa1/YidC/SpoIIIJ protein YidD